MLEKMLENYAASQEAKEFKTNIVIPVVNNFIGSLSAGGLLAAIAVMFEVNVDPLDVFVFGGTLSFFCANIFRFLGDEMKLYTNVFKLGYTLGKKDSKVLPQEPVNEETATTQNFNAVLELLWWYHNDKVDIGFLACKARGMDRKTWDIAKKLLGDANLLLTLEHNKTGIGGNNFDDAVTKVNEFYFGDEATEK